MLVVDRDPWPTLPYMPIHHTLYRPSLVYGFEKKISGATRVYFFSLPFLGAPNYFVAWPVYSVTYIVHHKLCRCQLVYLSVRLLPCR